MSDYQYYEFGALDRPLSSKQVAELRAIAPRAEVSPTRFWSEYYWGGCEADPAKLVRHYFDALLHFANRGTHRLMLRIPTSRIDAKALGPYFARRGGARLTRAGEHVVIDLRSEAGEPEGYAVSMSVLSALRTDLMRGDLRPAYLAWLLAVQAGDVDDDAVEPPVPPGLARLTPAQEAMVAFLRIDPAAIAAAAAEGAAILDDGPSFRRWVAHLPAKKKDAWLRRAAGEPALALGGEMLRAFRAAKRREGNDARARRRPRARRTAAQLRAIAEALRDRPEERSAMAE